MREKGTAFIPSDSRNLPPRVDFTDPEYLGLGFCPEICWWFAGKAKGTVLKWDGNGDCVGHQPGRIGMYCNSLMLNKALYGRLPDNPPPHWKTLLTAP